MLALLLKILIPISFIEVVNLITLRSDGKMFPKVQIHTVIILRGLVTDFMTEKQLQLRSVL